MKNILIILYLILFNCAKIIDVNKYSINKSSEEEPKLRNKNDIEEQKLIKAVKEGNKNGVIKILKKGVNLDYEDYKNRTPLMYALAGSKKSIVKILANAGCDISRIYVFDEFFNWKTHYKFLKLLIKRGHLDVNSYDEEGNTLIKYCLHYFEYCLHQKDSFEEDCPFHRLLNYIVVRNFNLNYINIKGGTPLTNALLSYDYYAVKLFLRHGAAPNVLNTHGNSPLMEFVREENNLYGFEYSLKNYYIENIIKILIKFGAGINIKNSYGDTALTLAIRASNLKAIEILLKLCTNEPLNSNIEGDAISASIKRIGEVLKEYSHLKNNKFILKKSIYILRMVLASASLKSKDKDFLINKNPNIIENLKLIKHLLNITTKNNKFSRLLPSYDTYSNKNRVFFIKDIDIDKDFKNNLIKKMDALIFHHDSFIFRNSSLLIESFLKVVKLCNLEKRKDVKEVNETLKNSLINYYVDKMNNREGYEERFLGLLAIVKSKVNIIIGDLYSYVKKFNSK